jgi:uncharacterized membrane protein YhiD involved in acid resistance
MFDFTSITTNVQQPSAMIIAVTLLLSFILSLLLVFTFVFTSREVAYHEDFIQSLVFLSIVTAVIMQAIGDSLARGLGMFGALAILRFRTTISNPRSVAFVFGAIAIGIACGVYSFWNAIIGTASFCLIAVIFRFTPFSKSEDLIAELHLFLPNEAPITMDDIEKTLATHAPKAALKRRRIVANKRRGIGQELEYALEFKTHQQGSKLVDTLHNTGVLNDIRLNFIEKPLRFL